MIRLNGLKVKYFKLNDFKNYLYKLSELKSWIFKAGKIPKFVNFSLLRISPVDDPISLKEQFIPLARSTIIRTLSQTENHSSKLNATTFDEFNRYLDSCITNRNYLFLKEIKSNFEHLNPDVEVLSSGVKWIIPRRQVLDDEFWFMQKLCRLLELANFREISRQELEKWLQRHGGFGTVQIWFDPTKYEMLKVWMQGRENSKKKGYFEIIGEKYFPFLSYLGNPFKNGHIYRRVAIAVRVKKSNKIELKMYKELSEGELIHTLPLVEVCNSNFDNTMMLWTGSLLVFGLSISLMLPAATIESGFLLTSTHQLATSLAVLSGGVGFLNWHVIQQKKSNYWKWRSEFNYRSIVANNRGVISLLGDRAQDEIFKECILSYVNILNNKDGIIQKDLEFNIKEWALRNCSPDFKETAMNLEINLTEALSLLRQLNIVCLDPSNQLLRAKPLDLSTSILGSEFNLRNHSIELDGSTVIRDDSNKLHLSEPMAEGYEKKNRQI